MFMVLIKSTGDQWVWRATFSYYSDALRYAEDLFYTVHRGSRTGCIAHWGCPHDRRNLIAKHYPIGYPPAP